MRTSVLRLLTAAEDKIPFGDAEVLDSYSVPFGEWVEQTVKWVIINLKWLLGILEWPFEVLINTAVDQYLVKIPWYIFIAAVFVIAWFLRNLTVAFGSSVALLLCSLLGPGYWAATVKTIGFVLVAVLMCVVIGIPLGILCGRFDSVWQIIRPTLDAMQVVHSFVYLLPFVYFFGIGDNGAAMATIVFAVPPLVRLTNLGIRGVPEDVVEAARSYGASEMRVLRDVQLPLARPAILTGINQTLLLAFSMLGVAAIMGAGGLGQMMFRALGNQEVSLAASSGLAFFLTAVMMDRIAQPQGASGRSLASRMTAAWKSVRNPETLVADPAFNPDADDEVTSPTLIDLTPAERGGIIVALVGAVAAVASVFLPWSQGAGLASSFSRRADESLAEPASGLAASGGSWFAIGLLSTAAIIAASGIVALLQMENRPRWLTPAGAGLGSVGAVVVMVAYLVMRPSVGVTEYSHGLGVYVALGGAVLATIGSFRWAAVAPYAPRRPLKDSIRFGPLVLSACAIILSVVATQASWFDDARKDNIMTPEVIAQIDEVKERAKAGEIDANVAATEVRAIRAKATEAGSRQANAFDAEGPGFGPVLLVATVVGAVGAGIAAGVAGNRSRRRWIGGIVTMGAGFGTMLVCIGWIGTLARATDPLFVSAAGVMFGLIGGFLTLSAGRTLVGGYDRRLEYDNDFLDDYTPNGETDTEQESSTVPTPEVAPV